MKVGRDSARNTFSPPHYENENTLARNREPKSQTKMCLSVRVQTLNRIMTSKVALKIRDLSPGQFLDGNKLVGISRMRPIRVLVEPHF